MLGSMGRSIRLKDAARGVGSVLTGAYAWGAAREHLYESHKRYVGGEAVNATLVAYLSMSLISAFGHQHSLS